MRIVLPLALVGLLLTGTGCADRNAPKGPRVVGEVVEVSGHGADADAARNQALKNAQDEVAGLLRERLGTSSGRAFTVEEMQRLRVIQSIGAPEPSRAKALPGEPLVEVKCRVALTEASIRAVQGAARQGVLLRVIAALVVVFAVVCGYLRLEEWTRGYATKLLRLLVSLVLIAAGIILWLTW